MQSDKSGIRLGAVLLQDNDRPPQGSSFFSSPAHWCCATLIHLNILVLGPLFLSLSAPAALSSPFSLFIIFSGKAGRRGEGRASVLSTPVCSCSAMLSSAGLRKTAAHAATSSTYERTQTLVRAGTLWQSRRW